MSGLYRDSRRRLFGFGRDELRSTNGTKGYAFMFRSPVEPKGWEKTGYGVGYHDGGCTMFLTIGKDNDSVGKIVFEHAESDMGA